MIRLFRYLRTFSFSSKTEPSFSGLVVVFWARAWVRSCRLDSFFGGEISKTGFLDLFEAEARLFFLCPALSSLENLAFLLVWTILGTQIVFDGTTWDSLIGEKRTFLIRDLGSRKPFSRLLTEAENWYRWYKAFWSPLTSRQNELECLYLAETI